MWKFKSEPISILGRCSCRTLIKWNWSELVTHTTKMTSNSFFCVASNLFQYNLIMQSRTMLRSGKNLEHGWQARNYLSLSQKSNTLSNSISDVKEQVIRHSLSELCTYLYTQQHIKVRMLKDTELKVTYSVLIPSFYYSRGLFSSTLRHQITLLWF